MIRNTLNRANVTLTAVIVLLLAVVVALIFAMGGAPTPYLPLDPDDPSPQGGRAVAQVLRERGVTVTVVRTPQALRDTPRADTVLVTDPNTLSASTRQTLEQRVKGHGRLLLIAPTHTTLHDWSLPLDTAGQAPATGAADCPAPQLTPTLRLEGASLLYTAVPTDFADHPTYRCFASAATDHAKGHGVVVVPTFDMTVVAVGTNSPWSNSHVLKADHAAVALRLTGQDATSVLWYVPPKVDPTLSDADNAKPSPMPGFLFRLLLGGTVLVIAIAFWRGRRFGRLIREPLPVLVAASETSQARGRLYGATRDATSAANVLRRATHRRLARRLGLPPDASLDHLIARAPQHAEQLHAHLAGGPLSAKHLPGLVTHLRRLEKEIGRP